MKTYTIPELAKLLKVHEDTLYKAKRNKAVSKKLAVELERITGITRLRWLYPNEFGDPWDLLLTQ